MRRRVFSTNVKWDIWDGKIATSFESGIGTDYDPYIISTTQQFAYFANKKMSAGGNYKITSNLDLNNIEWTTVATLRLSPYSHTIVDGGGNMIRNLKLNANESSVGLFMGYGWLSVSNLGVCSGSIVNGNSNTAVGTFTGRTSSGEINNCFSRCNVSAPIYYLGGIIGYGAQSDDIGGHGSKLNNCYYAGATSGGARKSGIVSVLSNATTVNNCWNNNTTNPTQNGHNYNAPNKTDSEMKNSAFVNQLGAAYKTDTENKNAGYPVLKTY